MVGGQGGGRAAPRHRSVCAPPPDREHAHAARSCILQCSTVVSVNQHAARRLARLHLRHLQDGAVRAGGVHRRGQQQRLPEGRRGGGGVRRVGRLGVGQPAPPRRARLRPPPAAAGRVAVPLAQLPGAAARGRARGTRARHAGLRAPRRRALQAAPAARRHRRRLPARPQPRARARAQPLARAPRRLPPPAVRALPPGAPAALRPPPPRPRRRQPGRRRGWGWGWGRAVLALRVRRRLRRGRRRGRLLALLLRRAHAAADLEPQRRWISQLRGLERRQRARRGVRGGGRGGGRGRGRGLLAAVVQRALRRRVRVRAARRAARARRRRVRRARRQRRLLAPGHVEVVAAVRRRQPVRDRDGGVFHGGARVRELRRHPHAAVAARRHRPLPLQRVRPLQQDERHEPAAQAAAAAGTSAQRHARAARAARHGHEAARHGVHQLPHHHHVAVAPQRQGRDGVQRLRPLLQAAQHQPPARHEEGLHPDQEAEAQKQQHEGGAEPQEQHLPRRLLGQRQARELTGERRAALAAAAGLLRAARAQAGGAAAGAPRARARARARAGHGGARARARARAPALRGGGVPARARGRRARRRRVARQLSAPLVGRSAGPAPAPRGRHVSFATLDGVEDDNCDSSWCGAPPVPNVG